MDITPVFGTGSGGSNPSEDTRSWQTPWKDFPGFALYHIGYRAPRTPRGSGRFLPGAHMDALRIAALKTIGRLWHGPPLRVEWGNKRHPVVFGQGKPKTTVVLPAEVRVR